MDKVDAASCGRTISPYENVLHHTKNAETLCIVFPNGNLFRTIRAFLSTSVLWIFDTANVSTTSAC
ncbi:hypothetical protein, partial [Pseudomonas fluorescens]|uniref:hypothetical protein n=1 Tax=Pseudomonas fluorescens TaxID=294 RepID=UPI001BE82B23